MKTVPNILLVDSNSDFVYNVSLTLDAAGYRILTASDGLQALAMLESEAVDLILSDIEMPYLDGYQLYQRVRESPKWTAIPFIFLTAQSLSNNPDCQDCQGIDGYLTKPIRASELIAAVRRTFKVRSMQI